MLSVVIVDIELDLSCCNNCLKMKTDFQVSYYSITPSFPGELKLFDMQPNLMENTLYYNYSTGI